MAVIVAKFVGWVYPRCTDRTTSSVYDNKTVVSQPAPSVWYGPATGTNEPKASDVLYVRLLAAPFTVNTMPEATLKTFADHGKIVEILSVHPEEPLAKFAKAGIDTNALAAQLLDERPHHSPDPSKT